MNCRLGSLVGGFLALFSVPLIASSAAGYLIGVPVGFTPGTAPLVKIDPVSGVYTTLSTFGNSYHALAQNSQGELFGGYFSTTTDQGRVARIDPLTGAPLQVFTTVTPGAGGIRGLAFDASDRLLAVVNRDDQSGSPTINDDLYEINLAAQTTSLIGSLNFMRVQGLDVTPDGTVYAWDVGAGLLRVNPTTGAATDVNPALAGSGAIQSIVFAPDGRLFGAGTALFSINPATGAFAQIGPGGGPDLRGIEWVVPEPSTALLSMFASCLLFQFRRGRGRAA